MPTKFIFDIDGTITPSRQRMDIEFARWFSRFAEKNQVYLITGSDREKTLEQINPVVYNRAKIVYQCGGNDVWRDSVRVRTSKFDIDEELESNLLEIVNQSKFYRKRPYGHIDRRPGLVNFSIVGRPCDFETRVMYKQWDEHKNERKTIARELSWDFPKYNFKVAGETGIDITSKGSDKSQILRDFDASDTIWFFGDCTFPGGNDHEIAEAVIARGGSTKAWTIESWRHTWNILKKL